MNRKQLTKIIDYVEINGGATVTEGGEIASLNYGYMVSLAGFEVKTSLKRLDMAKINRHLGMAKARKCFVGLWVCGGCLYLDLSELVEDFGEAVRLGEARKQLAIYDNALREAIEL